MDAYAGIMKRLKKIRKREQRLCRSEALFSSYFFRKPASNENWVKNNLSVKITDITDDVSKKVLIGGTEGVTTGAINVSNKYGAFMFNVKTGTRVRTIHFQLYFCGKLVEEFDFRTCGGTDTAYNIEFKRKAYEDLCSKIWTAGMSTDEKLQAVCDYIESKTYYMEEYADKDYK